MISKKNIDNTEIREYINYLNDNLLLFKGRIQNNKVEITKFEINNKQSFKQSNDLLLIDIWYIHNYTNAYTWININIKDYNIFLRTKKINKLLNR